MHIHIWSNIKIAIKISNSESESTQIIFEAVQVIFALKTIYEFDYEPDTLLGDYAQAITNGFTIAWEREPEYRIVCWAHCLRIKF
jgi:hypothetical protein